MKNKMRKISLAAIVVLLVLNGGLALATIQHVVPTPASLGTDWHLEPELANSMSPIWVPSTLWGISHVNKSGTLMTGGWFQWEGLNLYAGNYDLHMSFSAPGSWSLSNELWAGPDAANLRQVVSSFYAYHAFSTVGYGDFGWHLATTTPASPFALLATDKVVRIYANGVSVSPEIFIDDFMLTTAAVPEPATMLLLGLGSLVCLKLKRRK